MPGQMRSSIPMPQEVKLTTQAGVNINFVNTTVNSRVTSRFSTAPNVERHCQQYDIVWFAALRSHKGAHTYRQGYGEQLSSRRRGPIVPLLAVIACLNQPYL